MHARLVQPRQEQRRVLVGLLRDERVARLRVAARDAGLDPQHPRALVAYEAYHVADAALALRAPHLGSQNWSHAFFVERVAEQDLALHIADHLLEAHEHLAPPVA